MENRIEEDIKIALDKFSDNKDIDSAILIVEKFILGNYILRGGRKNIVKDSLRYILSDYKRVLKENECLKNHVHYKNCIACGKEFKSKRDDAKYCIKCSKQIANKNYIANLTEEQKLKRREQAKLAMRKLRANRK